MLDTATTTPLIDGSNVFVAVNNCNNSSNSSSNIALSAMRDNMTRLLDGVLTTNYDKVLRPNQGGPPILVSVNIQVISLIEGAISPFYMISETIYQHIGS